MRPDKSSLVLRQSSFQTGDQSALKNHLYGLLQGGKHTLNEMNTSIFDGQNLVDVVVAAREWKHPYIKPNSSIYFVDAEGRLIQISMQRETDAVIFAVVTQFIKHENDIYSEGAETYLLPVCSISEQKKSQVSNGFLKRIRELLFSRG